MPTKITIGLDFGTTYSGVAWATTTCPDELEIVQSWPGSKQRTSDKVPSQLAYDDTRTYKRFHWGFQIPPYSARIRGLKLLLDESQEDRYQPASEAKAMLIKLGISPVEVVADYLRELFAVGREHLERCYSSSFVDSADIKIILTVPAVWSDKAQDATMRAARLAGLSKYDLSLLSEPEAAALYALRSIRPNDMMEGDTFVVCDAGGGTVDLITYRIKSVEPMDLIEVVPGSGGICGAATLDKRFEDFVKHRLGVRYAQMNERGKVLMLASWINGIKCSFQETGDDGLDEHLVTVPGVSDEPLLGIEGGVMPLDSDDVVEIFDPVIRDVERLVEEQVDMAAGKGEKVKAILLVGGFGANQYLYQRISAKFSSLQVMQPPNAWSAVVRGAVLHGNRVGSVSSRKARKHYGVSASSKYDAKKHGERAKSWNRLEEVWQVDNEMSWFISKGMDIKDKQEIRLPFYRTISLKKKRGSCFRFEDLLICCEQDCAPDFEDEHRMFDLCTLTADLTEIPKKLFEQRTNSQGETYYYVDYELVMTMSSASIMFTLEFNGVSYGGVSAKFY